MADDEDESSGSSGHSGSSSDEEMIAAVALVAPYLRSNYARDLHHDSELQGAAYYAELLQSRNEFRFYDAARMRRPTFDALLSALQHHGGLRGSARISAGEKLMMTLMVMTTTTNRTVAERWQHSGSAVSRAVSQVLTAGSEKPQTKEELFNLRHSSLRNVIERLYGVVKNKFPILRTMLPYSMKKQVQLVLCAMVFHNFIRRSNESLGPLDNINLDTFVEGDDISSEIESLSTATTNLNDNAEMARTRDAIASKMWIDYRMYIAERDQTAVI